MKGGFNMDTDMKKDINEKSDANANTSNASQTRTRPQGAPQRRPGGPGGRPMGNRPPMGGRGPMGRGPMRGAGDRPTNMGKALTDLFRHESVNGGAIIFALVLAVIGVIIMIIGPDYISRITDLISEGLQTTIDMNAILSIATTLLILYIVSALCNFGQHFIMQTVAQNVSKALRGDIDRKINRLPLKYFNANASGDILSRMTNDVDTVGMAMSNSLATLVSSAVQFIGCLIMMYITNAIMATSALVITILAAIVLVVIMTHSQKYFVARQTTLGDLDGYIEEMYSGHDVIRILNADGSVKDEFSGLNRKVKKANFNAQFVSGLMQPLMTFAGNLCYVVVCIVGAALVINGSITFGVITAFLIYVRLFDTPLRNIATNMTQVQSCAAAAERVFDFLAEEEQDDESEKTERINDTKGAVEFRHVKFAYPDSPEKEIIHDFSAKIEPGQKVAIVGPTGAGKTTMVNLLMRFFEPVSGEIYIDGVRTSNVPRTNVHDQFGMVLQDTWLFEGTVRENLVYNNPREVSDEELDRACKACGIYHFVHALSHGYDTVLDDNTSVSAGQKQLITIARAMIQNSPILILDEATSSVDTRTEAITQKAMDALTESRTSFIIAHRLSTIRDADLILVMNDGDIVEQGTHEELLKQNGFYADLYNSQFEHSEAV